MLDHSADSIRVISWPSKLELIFLAADVVANDLGVLGRDGQAGGWLGSTNPGVSQLLEAQVDVLR